MTKFRQFLGYEFKKITEMQGGLMVLRLWVLLVVAWLASLYGGQGISACAGGDASQSFQSSVFSDQCFAPLEFELVDFRSPVDGDVVTDGHSSVRGVTGAGGVLLEKVDYDAFPPRRAGGVLLGAREWDDVSGQMVGVAEPLSDGYFYSGERWDSDLGMYYLRARYLNAGSGRFHTMDDYEGRRGEPVTLHKYFYGNGNPVSYVDPSGRSSSISEGTLTTQLSQQISRLGLNQGLNYQVRKKVTKKIACFVIEEVAENIIGEGIYLFVSGTLGGGLPYVGQSVDIDRRLKEHLKGKLDKVDDLVAKFGFKGGSKTEREKLEQLILNFVRGGDDGTLRNVANKQSPLGKQRRLKFAPELKLCK